MPVKPKPIEIRCKSCHWRTIFAPASDVMIGMPDTCPKCGSDALEHRAVSSPIGWLLSLLARET